MTDRELENDGPVEDAIEPNSGSDAVGDEKDAPGDKAPDANVVHGDKGSGSAMADEETLADRVLGDVTTARYGAAPVDD